MKEGVDVNLDGLDDFSDDGLDSDELDSSSEEVIWYHNINGIGNGSATQA